MDIKHFLKSQNVQSLLLNLLNVKSETIHRCRILGVAIYGQKGQKIQEKNLPWSITGNLL